VAAVASTYDVVTNTYRLLALQRSLELELELMVVVRAVH
jgi:hypothetical protein